MKLLVALTGGRVKEEAAGEVSQRGGEADRRCPEHWDARAERGCVRPVARGLVGSASSRFLHSWQLCRRLGFSFLFLKMQG